MLKHLCKLVWNRKRINFLITIEIFFSFIVTFAVIIFAVYYTDNYRQGLGFKYDNVWAIQLRTNNPEHYKNIHDHNEGSNLQPLATINRILMGVREFSEVETVAPIWFAPYSEFDPVMLENMSELEFGFNETSEDLKDALELNIVNGRWFSKEDDAVKNYLPVVISQKFARTHYGKQNPIGKVIEGPRFRGEDGKEEVVIGVIDNFRFSEFAPLRGYKFSRINFNDKRQQIPNYLLLKVRPGVTAAFEEKLLARLQAEAADWSFNIKPLVEMRRSKFQEYLVPIAAFSLVAGFLLIMVALGLTGVLWQNVTQRTKEIGLRRAKGATKGQIYRHMLGELLVITSAGLIAGVLVVIQFPLLNFMGFASAKVYANSIIISLTIIYLLTIISGFYPSLLATRVQPAEALHYE